MHLRAFAQELSVGRRWIDDFEGAVLVQVDGSTFVAVRTDVVVSPPWVAPALIIGAPSLEKALSLIDQLEARQEELTAGRVQTFGTSLVWLDVTPTCQALRIAPSRGVLFVGQPGTGKSLAIRHLLERYHTCRRLVYAPEIGSRGGGESPFGELVNCVAASTSPAIAVGRVCES